MRPPVAPMTSMAPQPSFIAVRSASSVSVSSFSGLWISHSMPFCPLNQANTSCFTVSKSPTAAVGVSPRPRAVSSPASTAMMQS